MRSHSWLIVLALVASSVQAEVADRARQSWIKGTGGLVAAEALCNMQAVLEFYDGHQTPELIPDDLLFWHLGFFEGATGPPDLSKNEKVFVAEGLALLSRDAEDLWNRGKQRARQLDDAGSAEAADALRQRIFDDTIRTQDESRALASELLDTIRQRLSGNDREIFERWIEQARRESVILVRDPSKMIRFDASECNDYLPARVR